MIKTSKNKVIIYTDGGAVNNPGPAAIGIIIDTGEGRLFPKKYSEYIGEATNNQAEYRALIFAFKKVKALFGKKKIKDLKVEFYLDSKLLVEQINGKFKIKEKDLQPLFLEIWNLKIDFGNVSFNYVPREKNQEADILVKNELRKKGAIV